MKKNSGQGSSSTEEVKERTPAVVETTVGGERPPSPDAEETAGSRSSASPAEQDAGYRTVLAAGTIKTVPVSAGESAETGDGAVAETARAAAGSEPGSKEAGASGASTDAEVEKPGDQAEKAAGESAGTTAGAKTAASGEKAEAAASGASPAGTDSTAGGQRPGRPPAPVLAAAAIGGLVLLGVPLALSQVGFFGDGHKKTSAAGMVPGAAPQDGYHGYVPPTAAPSPGATPPHSGQPTPSASGPGDSSSAHPAANGAGTDKTQGAFKVVAGPGCGGGAYARVGYYSDGKSGWLGGSGAYSGDGCGGRFDALPMSGGTSGDDPGVYARWTFDPGSKRQCKVQVYIPNNSDKVYVGGDPAHYSVHQVSSNTGLAGFSVDQPQNRGHWVTGRSFTTQGAFYVRLDNTGKDWSGSEKTYAHVAAAQVRATCS